MGPRLAREQERAERERRREEWDRLREEARRRRQGSAAKDPYTVLGILVGATQREIRSAWIALVKRHHPDHGGDAAMFREVRGAPRDCANRRSKEISMTNDKKLLQIASRYVPAGSVKVEHSLGPATCRTPPGDRRQSRTLR